MGQVPARLVYTDSTGTDQVIGRFLPQDVTSGNISTFTIEENAKNYKRVIIEGGPTLDDNMPTTISDFNGDEPEIRVQVDSDLNSTWENRLRVYPEESGTTDDKGRYKNKNLWGFKKYYGEDDVVTGTVTTNLTDVLDAKLPNGYVARYPGDITPPNVSGYSYQGSRQQGFQEIWEHYRHYVIFTDETDGSGNYYVDLQPKGYGSTQFSLTRGQDPLTYQYWKNSDTSEIISKVKVVGKDSTNSKVERVVAAGSSTGVHGSDSNVDVYLGSPEPDRKVFKQLQVDYTITESEADSIAENIIEPTSTQQGKIESELRIQSTLNESVGIIDSSRNVDDVFTVVQQKDFLHQGVTSYSFEFEKEATDQQRAKWREHDNERAKVYTDSSKNVGPLGLNVGDANAQTSSSSSNDYDNGEAQTSSSSSAGDANAQTSSSTSVSTSQLTVGDNKFSVTDSDNFSSVSVPSSDWEKMTNGSATGSTDALAHKVTAQITSSDDSGFNFFWVLEQNGILLDMGYDRIETDTNGNNALNISGTTYWRKTRTVSLEQFEGNSTDLSYDLHIKTAGGASPTLDGSVAVTELNHVHDASGSTSTTDSGHGSSATSEHVISTSTSDSGHGGEGQPGDHNVSTSTSTSDSGHGSSSTDPHGGDTDQDSLDVTVEDQTDR